MNVRSHDPSPRSRDLHGSRTILTIVSNAQSREFRRPTKCSSPSSFFETRDYNAEEWLPGRKLPAPVSDHSPCSALVSPAISADGFGADVNDCAFMLTINITQFSTTSEIKAAFFMWAPGREHCPFWK
jgi:hypothetical protein